MFSGLPNLQELGLGANNLTSLESGMFSELTNLKELGLNFPDKDMLSNDHDICYQFDLVPQKQDGRKMWWDENEQCMNATVRVSDKPGKHSATKKHGPTKKNRLIDVMIKIEELVLLMIQSNVEGLKNTYYIEDLTNIPIEEMIEKVEDNKYAFYTRFAATCNDVDMKYDIDLTTIDYVDELE